jgi:hypothetical protein
MMRKSLMPLALVVVGILLLFGWGTMAGLEAADPSPEPIVATSEPADEEEVQSTEETDSRFPLPAPTTAAVPEIDNSGCIACHTAQKDLQALAQEPEQTESLSEGEG